MSGIKTVGSLFNVAYELYKAGSKPDIIMDIHYGDNFNNYWYEGEDLYDIANYTRLPNSEETRALEAMLAYKVTSVLDVGAGSGRVSQWWQDRGVSVTACENDSACVAMCKKRGLDVVENLSAINEYYQLVMLFGGGLPGNQSCFDLEDQTTEFLGLLYDRVVPGGYLLVDVVNDDSLAFMSDPNWKVATLRYRLAELVSDYESYVYPHRDVLKRIMSKKGAIVFKEWLMELPAYQPDLEGCNYVATIVWQRPYTN